MTDTDPRLEAAAKAHREAELSETLSWDQRKAKRFISMYDALRAFDQAQPSESDVLAQVKRMQEFLCERGLFQDYMTWIENREEVMPHSEPRAQTRSEHNATAPVMGADPPLAWPDPTPEMQVSPLFDAIWSVIKTWDIAVPEAYGGYCSATGNHVRTILDAINAQPPSGETK